MQRRCSSTIEDVWIPLFELTGETDPVDRVVEPTRPTVRLPLTDDRYEHKSVISGIGRSDLGRRLMRDPLSLAVDASLAAIADAGLTPDDIDGIATYPGGGGYEIGFSEGGITAARGGAAAASRRGSAAAPTCRARARRSSTR